MGRETRELWAERVERWQHSGLTAERFAAREGVNARTLAYWKWKLRHGEQRARSEERGAIRAVRAADFVELVARRAVVTQPAATFEVVLARGYRVRIEAGFESEALTRLLDVLEARR